MRVSAGRCSCSSSASCLCAFHEPTQYSKCPRLLESLDAIRLRTAVIIWHGVFSLVFHSYAQWNFLGELSTLNAQEFHSDNNTTPAASLMITLSSCVDQAPHAKLRHKSSSNRHSPCTQHEQNATLIHPINRRRSTVHNAPSVKLVLSWPTDEFE